MSHTPGPWEVVNDFNSTNSDGALASICGVDKHDYYIAQVWCDFEADADERPIDGIQPFGTAAANARLIAAAPDLLNALKALLAACHEADAREDLDAAVDGSLLDASVNAIAKAERSDQ